MRSDSTASSLAAAEQLENLAERLLERGPVAARDIAQTRLLLSDGLSPLYFHGASEDLHTLSPRERSSPDSNGKHLARPTVTNVFTARTHHANSGAGVEGKTLCDPSSPEQEVRREAHRTAFAHAHRSRSDGCRGGLRRNGRHLGGAAVKRLDLPPARDSGRGIKHVVYVVWDNTHLLRDNPNVPSDLQQMPHLLNFLRDNGSLLSNEHTPLIAHTANDIVSSLTGLYPDQQGLNVANSYGYFNADGSISFPSAFTYWTDPVQTSTTPNPPYNLITQQGNNAPAPWVPFTRGGCNVAAIASGDIALENTNTSPTGDITRIFGTSSPYYAEAQKENGSGAPQGLASANFEGLAIHCAKDSTLCGKGEPDLLPDEPRGYNGFKGLFGALQVNPVLTGRPVTTVGGYMRSPALTALDGRPILDGDGNAGFDGIAPANSLAFVASMLEHGVPVAFAYLTDAHDNQASGTSFGPGETGYVQRLHAYDQAFATFFARLQKDGINKSNTLFVFTADEGDHFVGAKPANAGCDGVNVPCSYDQDRRGRRPPGATAPGGDREHHAFCGAQRRGARVLHQRQSRTRQPDHPPAGARQRESDRVQPAHLPRCPLTQFLAGPTELGLLHMETGDPHRNPSFVMFANPDYYLDANSSSCPSTARQPGCVYQYPGDAYNHGDVYPEINRTWLGLVGPGVKKLGETAAIWSSHTDDRPTVLALLGLRDDYVHEGRVLTEALDHSVISPDLRTREALQMQRVYTQLESPVGEFGMETLPASTGALAAGDPGDVIYGQMQLAAAAAGRRTLTPSPARCRRC